MPRPLMPRPPPARAAPRSRGFTLVELLVCLALLSLLAMLSLPYVAQGGTALRLSADARVLAALLRSAREQALARRQSVAVQIDRAGHRALLEGAPGAVHLSAVEQLDVVTARGRAEEQLVAIAFQPDGGSSGALVVLQGGGARRSLRVDWLSGGVTLEER